MQLVMRHVCQLFSAIAVTSAQAALGSSSSSSSTLATSACVRQVLSYAVSLGAHDVLQELLMLIPVQDKLLTYMDVYILLLTSLRGNSDPRMIQMLCELRLSCPFGDPACVHVPVSKVLHLFQTTLSLHKNLKGMSEVLQALATWDPRPPGLHASGVGLASHFSHAALDDLCGQALEIFDDDYERTRVLEVLFELGGADYRKFDGWSSSPDPDPMEKFS
jgi:hypothetical protein